MKSGLLLSSLSLIFFPSFNNLYASTEQVSIQDLRSQAIMNCRLYAKMQMLVLLDVSIKLDGVKSVTNKVDEDTKIFKNTLKTKYKNIYKSCVRSNYNSINRVRIGNIEQIYKKYKYNYQAHKAYIKSFEHTVDNKELINKYLNILISS